MEAPECAADASFRRTYRGRTDTLNVARLQLQSWLSDANPLATSPDALLVLSELASNTIESGAPTFSVRASLSDATLSITVSNPTVGDVPSPDSWGPDDVLALQGRGLAIVQALAEEVTVIQAEGTTHVTAKLNVIAL